MNLLFQLWKSRELLLSLVKRDLKVRYKDSILGFFWSFGRPLFLMLILATVFSLILPLSGMASSADAVPFPLFLLTGLLPWMFLGGCLTDGTHVLLQNTSLIKKVSLNSAVFPASVVLGNLIHMILAFVVYFIFFFYYGQSLSLDLWIALPALLVQIIFLMSLTLICSALYVFYRDVSSITELLLAGWFYLTPLLYPADIAISELGKRFPEYAAELKILFFLNPMAPIIVAYRRAFLFTGDRPGEISDWHLFLALGATGAISIVLFAGSVVLFNRLSKQFADEL
jgi:ABC-2 type transport system permease protein